MIARIWHGKTKASDAAAYLEYLFKSGVPAYRATSGNKGAWVLRRHLKPRDLTPCRFVPDDYDTWTLNRPSPKSSG